ncbi:MAG: hypothetical protein RR748_15295, partial [Pseudomonas sp.]
LLGYLFAGPALRRLEKVTRRKGGTLSSRYRSNGYVPQPTKTSSTKRTPSLASQLPQGFGYIRNINCA